MEYIDVDSIIEGITIAVVAAIILGFYQWLSKRIAQREQIRYIRDIVAEGHEKVRDAMPIGGCLWMQCDLWYSSISCER